ncbi:MAG: hypothetical protein HRU82_14880 [Nitrospira sp.]|nr:MAG: hypothetical protein HRU82_14880 [Nitrospira sp.]
MSTAQIEIAYVGDAVEAGIMEIGDLAPALLSFEALFKEANFILNADRAYVTVIVRSDFKKGSFGIYLELVQHVVGQILSVAGDLKQAAEIAQLLGLFGGDGLLKFLKWLKGRTPSTVTKLENGTVKVDLSGSTISNSTIIIKPDVYALYSAYGVRRHFNGVVKPLQRQGIERLEMRKGKETVESISKEESSLLATPTPTENIVHEGDHVAVFQVVRVSFKERYKWTLSDGERNFNVAVHDDDFVKKVEEGQLSFRKGDSLKVHVQTVSRRTDHKGIVTEYKILKVIEVIKQPPQLNLPGT